MAQRYSFRGDTPELACLCSTLGAAHLVGLPQLGFPGDWYELAGTFEQAEARLLTQGDLVLDAGGRIAVHPSLHRLLTPVASPSAVLALTQKSDTNPEALLLYWHPPSLVILSFEASTQKWKVELQSQLSEAWKPVERFWKLPKLVNATPCRCQVPQSTFDQLLSDAHAEVTSVAFQGTGFSESQVTSLQEALLRPTIQGGLCSFERLPVGWGMESFTLLGGAGCLWKARPCQRSSEPWLEITSMKAEDLAERCSSLLRRVLRV